MVACPDDVPQHRKWLVLRGQQRSHLIAAVLGTVALATSVQAQDPGPSATLHEIRLRGGVRAALAAIGDRGTPDRSHFLLEVIRGVYDVPPAALKMRGGTLKSLLAHLDNVPASAPADTLPLPLHPDVWVRTVFGGHAEVETLAQSILSSRNAALLYYGLLSLDEATRAWFEGQPDLLAEIAAKGTGVFVAAAPGLRISNGCVHPPGGEPAVDIWQALVGQRVEQPAAFLRGLLAHSQGRLAYFFREMSQLSQAELQVALRLDTPDRAVRLNAGSRLFDLFERVAAGWFVEERVFWRPTLDPALLISELAGESAIPPSVPGTRAFWQVVIEDADRGRSEGLSADQRRALAAGEAADFLWLAEQIFRRHAAAQRQPFDMVLFAARVIDEITPENVADALDAVRAAGTYPSLTTALERAGVTGVVPFARATRRADTLKAIDDVARAERALAQFQGSLALLTRAALRGGVPASAVADHVSSLAAVELNDRGEYEGRLVEWWENTLAAVQRSPEPGKLAPHPADWVGSTSSERYQDAVNPLDRLLVRFVSGGRESRPQHVEWEGTRYRLDLRWAEATRLGRMLGERPRPFLSSALALVRIARALGDPLLTREAVREQTFNAEQVQNVLPWRGVDKIVTALQRAAESSPSRLSSQLAPIASALRSLTDELLARGVTELVYAIALGQPDGALVTAGDAATRHDFGIRLFGPLGAWRAPVPGADRVRDWHVTGSLLGLDVRLADFALVRISSRPPPFRPTLNDADRRMLIQTVALIEASALDDERGNALVAALQNGRARLSAMRSPADVLRLADDIGLSGARRSLIEWTASHDLERVASLVAPVELLWLGLERKPLDAWVHAWGSPAEPRVGCLCLRMPVRRQLESYAGRWDSGILVSVFPDLNLRLAELLADLKMPARLLPSVLAAATLDLINLTFSRGQDDRRGLVDFVHGLTQDRLELYLALLTTDGPLVPLEDTGGGSAREVSNPEVSR